MKASKSKMNGIHKFLTGRGIKERTHSKLVTKYCELKGIGGDTFRRRCKEIQKDFTSFVKYIENERSHN